MFYVISDLGITSNAGEKKYFIGFKHKDKCYRQQIVAVVNHF